MIVRHSVEIAKVGDKWLAEVIGYQGVFDTWPEAVAFAKKKLDDSGCAGLSTVPVKSP